MKITEPGIYNISSEEYHADPCPKPSLSNSMAKILCKATPLHAWLSHPKLNPHFEEANRAKYDFGTAAHSVLLGDPRDFEIIDADAYRSKASKELREQAYADGKTPLLTEQWDRCNEMAESAKRQIQNIEALQPFLAKDALTEQTLIWKEKGFWFRSRVDRMSKNMNHLYDYKTTGGSAHPEQWASICFSNFFDVQNAFYDRFFMNRYSGMRPEFTYIVQETEPPYLLCAIRIDGLGLEMADKRAEWAIDIWQRCLTENKWPGYPNMPVWISPPYGQSRAWLESDGNEFSTMRHEMRDMMFKWQAPHDFLIGEKK